MDIDAFLDPILPREGPAKVAKLIRLNEKIKHFRKKDFKSNKTSKNTENPNSSASCKPSAELDAEESDPQGTLKCANAVVFDVGTGYFKAGFAGAGSPLCVIPSVSGLAHLGQSDYKRGYVGSEILNKHDISHVQPVHNGIITEWDAVERLWEYAFETLNVPSEEYAVLLSDPPLSPFTNREKLAEVMFERFSTPAIFIENQSVLSMYSYGRTSGLVLECGHGCSYAVPIDDGFYMPSYTSRAEYAGRSVDLYLQTLLKQSEKRVSWDKLGPMDEIKANTFYVAADVDTELRENDTTVQYTLPDGNSLLLGKERFLCPEVLFQPHLIESREPGLPVMVMNCINKCDINLKCDMLQNILLCGGSTMFRGFQERLQSELNRIAPFGEATVVASSERKNAVWLGGSILASLSSFQSLWIEKKDYEEKGPLFIYQKCF